MLGIYNIYEAFINVNFNFISHGNKDFNPDLIKHFGTKVCRW